MCERENMSSVTGILDIHPEIIVHHLFLCLPLNQLCRCASVCTLWYHSFRDEHLWLSLCSEAWRISPTDLREKGAGKLVDLQSHLAALAQVKENGLSDHKERIRSQDLISIAANRRRAVRLVENLAQRYGSLTCGCVQSKLPLHPLPTLPWCPERQILYFETQIILCQENPAPISIGLAPQGFQQRAAHVGWYPFSSSYGYHGDNGGKFPGKNDTAHEWEGEAYAQTFAQGDVVGCGYDCQRQEIFFTKNGKFQGIAFRDTAQRQEWRASAGTWEKHDTIEFNFGTDPFVFDIYHYMADPQDFQKEELSSPDKMQIEY